MTLKTQRQQKNKRYNIFFFQYMHHSYNFLSQSLRASIVQLHAPGNKNYCSERELHDILCVLRKFSPMKVLQIKFI